MDDVNERTFYAPAADLTYVKCTTVRSGSHCALRLRYVDWVVSNEVGVDVCYCFTIFSC
jgi:hypothetical protein